MSHAEMLAALDERLDALLVGTANFLDLTNDSSDALELQQLLTTARLTMQVLNQPLPPSIRERHLRLIKQAARRQAATPDGEAEPSSTR
jgi:hypothetical protein